MIKGVLLCLEQYKKYGLYVIHTAYSLHKNLKRFSLADRDAWWTKYLKNKFHDESAVKRLLDWAWSSRDKSHISDESIKLSTIAIAWLHTSTNKHLRNSATKALVCLLENRISVLISLMKEFEGVNDPYVYERLFAVAYGCALRTDQKVLLVDLSKYVFKTIFDVEGEIYPHILLRDYARGIIEHTLHLGYELDIDVSKSTPPYQSSLPKNFPTNEEIDKKYALDYNDKKFKDYYWSQINILDSMTTEYGRGTGGYGDFGRYVFQSALEDWDVDVDKLSNLAIEWVFDKYGYDKDKFGEFDRNIGSGRARSTYPQERIGKKYQWLAFYEILARVSDNATKYDRWSSEKTKENYKGTWNPYVRDIDPTMLINKTGSFNKDESAKFWWFRESYNNWNLTNNEWLETFDDLPKTENLLNVADENNEEWLVLEGNPEWSEPKKIGIKKWGNPHKRMWYQLRSYLVCEDEYEKIKKWASKQNFMGRWMPESPTCIYQLFSREYYSSLAYQDLYERIEQRKIKDRESNAFIGNVLLTTNEFLWEKKFDNISFIKPSKYIYENMGLHYSKREGEFIDNKGNIICFDPSLYNNSYSYLLIKKQPFLKFLKKKKLKLFWTVLGEKNIIGDHHYNSKDPQRLEISGAFYLNENEAVEGVINPKVV